MSLMGVGTMEVLLILLVAFLVLGPNKMVEAGRSLGKALREFRRMTSELPKITLGDEEETKSAEAPIVHRRGGPQPDDEKQDTPGGGPAS